MDWNANKMNTLHHVDPRSFQLVGGSSPRTPGMVLAPMMTGGGRPLVHLPGGGGGGHHPRMPHGRGPGPPPLQQHPPLLGQLGGGPQPPLFVEEQMDHLAGRLDMLENELRYAWRALDVLSQEYIKMWERLEKMEGLLTEQQTVITQLIDLYTADSSDNADNSFDADGALSGGVGGEPINGGAKFTGFGLKDPDESFYKALNAVHRDSYPNTADSTLPQVGDYPPPPPAPGPPLLGLDVVKSPARTAKAPKLKQHKDLAGAELQFKDQGMKQIPREKVRERRRVKAEEVEESPEQESRSVASNPSLYSSEVGEFPVPVDSSPTYENLTPILPGSMVAVGMPAGSGKRRLPQVPPDNRRTRKDGYIGKPEEEEIKLAQGVMTNKHVAKVKVKTSEEEAIIGTKIGKTNLDQRTSGQSTGSLNEQISKGERFTNVVEQEVQYDTYPRRKNKRKDKDKGSVVEGSSTVAASPLTVIDGNLSFSLTEESAPVTSLQQKEPKAEKSNSGRIQMEEFATSQKSSIDELPMLSEPRIISKTSEIRGITVGREQEASSGQAVARTGSQDVNSPLEGNLSRTSSLYQQIQARESESVQDLKSRKLSLKEKRKLRAEQRELGTELMQKTGAESELSGQNIPIAKKLDSSESDVSMRSDHSVSPKRDSGDMELLDQSSNSGSNNGLYGGDQQGARPRSNGLNLLPMQQQQVLGSSSKSREFAVSRALGKYRQKQKERESLQGSSNSDSQEELDITGTETRSELSHEGSLKTIDIKLAGIEESTEPEVFQTSLQEQTARIVPSDLVQKQVSQFELTGFSPFDMLKQQENSSGKSRSRRQSTEESIDTEDEWYQHEMMRLEKLESDQSSEKIEKSGSLHDRMNQVVGELNKSVSRREQKSLIQFQLAETEPPDKPPETKPPDIVEKEEARGEKEKKRISRRTASEDSDSSATASEQDEEEEDDSETQSGADTDVDEEEDAAKISSLTDVSKRPGNLTIIPSEPKLNISNVPNKPDLLQEVTAAAAEAAYPEHLKNGSYGEDGLWYDEHGETGYFDEDGTWFDYIDEIGYYNDEGEWIEYDYTKGYWGDDGEWHENEKQKDDEDKTSQQESPKNETDHFLWVSEEGIKGKTSNDQIPSSELQNSMVIGKPPSGSREDLPASDSCPDSDSRHSSTRCKSNKRDSILTGASASPSIQDSDEPTSEKDNFVEEEKDSVCELDERGPPENKNNGIVVKSGKRWGTLIKQHTAELMDLVRI